MNIKFDRDYIINVLDKVKTGKYAVPEFQCDLSLTIHQILDLFDSIIKGYPIGSLVFWQPDSARFNVLTEISGIFVEEKDALERLYVLEGAPMLATLISVLCEGGSYYSNIYINLDDFQILNVIDNKKQKFNYLDLGVAFDTYELVSYLDYLSQTELSEDKKKFYAERAKLVNRKLHTYELIYINVIGGNIEDAVEMISRANYKNKWISSDYLLQALTYQGDTDFLFANEISKIKQRLLKFNFERIDRDLILKCVYHYLNVPFIDGKEQMIVNAKLNLPTIIANVGKDVIMTVDFLHNQCGIIDCKLLPDKYQFVMIALFFKNNKNPNKTQLEELRKWFFYTAYTGYFTNNSLAIIRKDIMKFSLFSMGHALYPIEYVEEKFDLSLPDKPRLENVRTCVLAAISILNQNVLTQINVNLEVYVLPESGNKTWGNTFFLASKMDCEKLENFLKGNTPWDNEYAKYGLSEEIVMLYRNGFIEDFVEERKLLLLKQERSMLETLFSSNFSKEIL